MKAFVRWCKNTVLRFGVPALQMFATVAYFVLFAVGIAMDIEFKDGEPLPMPVTIVVVFGISALVMGGRLGYAVSNGLWATNKVTNKSVSIFSEAFLPERTTVVSLLIFVVISFGPLNDLYQPDEVTDVLNALIVTGGLIAALVTSPQHLPRLVDTVKANRQSLVNAWPASRPPNL